MATMCCTSSVDFTKATASGGAPGTQVWSLPCCSRTAWAVESRSPRIALTSATAWVTLFLLRACFVIRDKSLLWLLNQPVLSANSLVPMTHPAPFLSSVHKIEDQWTDYNGHFNMAYYNVLFDRAGDEAFEAIGL